MIERLDVHPRNRHGRGDEGVGVRDGLHVFAGEVNLCVKGPFGGWIEAFPGRIAGAPIQDLPLQIHHQEILRPQTAQTDPLRLDQNPVARWNAARNVADPVSQFFLFDNPVGLGQQLSTGGFILHFFHPSFAIDRWDNPPPTTPGSRGEGPRPDNGLDGVF